MCGWGEGGGVVVVNKNDDDVDDNKNTKNSYVCTSPPQTHPYANHCSSGGHIHQTTHVALTEWSLGCVHQRVPPLNLYIEGRPKQQTTISF